MATTIIEELEHVLAEGSGDKRVHTLRRITELFLSDAARYTATQVALFDRVICRLAEVMEAAVRRELAERLAPVDNAPPRIIRSLAQDDEIEVARPILLLSRQVDDDLLADIAATKTEEHRLAIAGRPILSEKVTDALVGSGGRQVMRKVAANEGASFSARSYEALAEKARDDDVLAECIGLRADVPPHLFRLILASARQQVQARLLASALQKDRERVRSALASVADRIAVGTSGAGRDHTAIHRAVLDLKRKGRLAEPEVRAYAEAGRLDETICALSALCDVPLEMVEKLFLGERVDPVLILARAAELDWTTVRAVLKVRPVPSAQAPAALAEAQESYEKLTRGTALRVLRFWQVRESSAQAG